jgi:hypothetical protein
VTGAEKAASSKRAADGFELFKNAWQTSGGVAGLQPVGTGSKGQFSISPTKAGTPGGRK